MAERSEVTSDTSVKQWRKVPPIQAIGSCKAVIRNLGNAFLNHFLYVPSIFYMFRSICSVFYTFYVFRFPCFTSHIFQFSYVSVFHFSYEAIFTCFIFSRNSSSLWKLKIIDLRKELIRRVSVFAKQRTTVRKKKSTTTHIPSESDGLTMFVK